MLTLRGLAALWAPSTVLCASVVLQAAPVPSYAPEFIERSPPPGSSAGGGLCVSKYIGCFADNINLRALPAAFGVHNAMTGEMCIGFCAGLGYAVAGTEWTTQCFCGVSTKALISRPEEECNMPCAGNSTQACGGPSRLSVYADASDEPITNPGDGETFEYVGCWTDSVSDRTLPNLVRTSSDPNVGPAVQTCAAACRAAGFLYAGVEYAGECWCGDDLSKATLQFGNPDEIGCNMPCRAKPSEYCGGPDRLNVYNLQPTHGGATPSLNTSISTPTASTVTVTSSTIPTNLTSSPPSDTLTTTITIPPPYVNSTSIAPSEASSLSTAPANSTSILPSDTTTPIATPPSTASGPSSEDPGSFAVFTNSSSAMQSMTSFIVATTFTTPPYANASFPTSTEKVPDMPMNTSIALPPFSTPPFANSSAPISTGPPFASTEGTTNSTTLTASPSVASSTVPAPGPPFANTTVSGSPTPSPSIDANSTLAAPSLPTPTPPLLNATTSSHDFSPSPTSNSTAASSTLPMPSVEARNIIVNGGFEDFDTIYDVWKVTPNKHIPTTDQLYNYTNPYGDTYALEGHQAFLIYDHGSNATTRSLCISQTAYHPGAGYYLFSAYIGRMPYTGPGNGSGSEMLMYEVFIDDVRVLYDNVCDPSKAHDAGGCSYAAMNGKIIYEEVHYTATLPEADIGDHTLSICATYVSNAEDHDDFLVDDVSVLGPWVLK